MKKISLKVISVIMVITLLCSLFAVSAVAAKTVDYKITNPYESVMAYIGSDANHYKTNLHTHSTYSDANINLEAMVKGHYNRDFDVLGMADHGVIGVEWNKTPTLLPLYYYNYAMLNNQKHLTDEEYEGILNGTYRTDTTFRKNERGMQCVTGGIEANYLVMQKNHINGYFMKDNRVEGVMGNEGDFETMVKMIEDAGGISHINHPGDWLGSADSTPVYDEEGELVLDVNGEPMTKGKQIAMDQKNVQFFANLYRKYDSCLGFEVYNSFDRPTSGDRVLWDELLKVVIPEGRNVWGFANNDAHRIEDIDTAFMDFVMPSYSMANVETAMKNGTFFAVSRYESGERIGNGDDYPQVTAISVDEDKDYITIIGKNTDKINWIADGKVIRTDTRKFSDGTVISEVHLKDHADDISCYVRAELVGEGGVTLTQAFVCDDGNMASLINRGPAAPQNVDIIALLRSFLKMILRTMTSLVVVE